MLNRPVLIICENAPPSIAHLSVLREKFNLICLVESGEISIPNNLKFPSNFIHGDVISIRGPITHPKFLYELRDFYFLPLLGRYKFEILIYSGSSAQVMPQYYVLKRLLSPSTSVAVYSPYSKSGIPGFHDELERESFDGISHIFVLNSSKFGFEVLTESHGD